jgi:hypothetical protein
MGRTVYGVDLEESPFGGLIEKLLTEEELEKLADGGAVAGRPGDRDTAPDGGGDAADDWNVSDETYGSPDDGSDPVESDAPSSPPSTAPDETDSTDDDGPDSTGYGEFGDAGFDDTGAEDDGGGVGGFLSTHKWLLLKVAVAFAALAAVLVVVWRYKDKLAGVVPGRGGGEDEFDADSDASADRDVSPARRRAKVDEDEDGAGATDEFDEEESVGGGDDSRQGPAARRPDESEGVTTPGQDVDLGALLGLGFLAFVAALVRKFDEERNRPHDPLVDGPLDEDDDDE